MSRPSHFDVRQGSRYDCTLLASFAAIASSEPERVPPPSAGKGWVQSWEDTYAHAHHGRIDNLSASRVLHELTGRPFESVALEPESAWRALMARAGQPRFSREFESRLREPVTALVPAEAPPRSLFAALGRCIARLFHAVLELFGAAHGYDTHHTYAVLGIGRDATGQRYVRLYNPRSRGEPVNDGRDDGEFRISLTEFCRSFSVMTHGVRR